MKRSIPVAIILSLVTCGIYTIYWFVKLTDEMNALSGKQNPTSGVMALVLTLVTCGIYGFYWAYKMGEAVDVVKQRSGIPSGSSSVLFLVLMVIGLGFINYCLIQDTINNNVA